EASLQIRSPHLWEAGLSRRVRLSAYPTIASVRESTARSEQFPLFYCVRSVGNTTLKLHTLRMFEMIYMAKAGKKSPASKRPVKSKKAIGKVRTKRSTNHTKTSPSVTTRETISSTHPHQSTYTN